MTLKQLTIFLTLAHEGSFTKTASKLNCAQSGVTTHIKLLETELGVPLFQPYRQTHKPYTRRQCPAAIRQKNTLPFIRSPKPLPKIPTAYNRSNRIYR